MKAYTEKRIRSIKELRRLMQSLSSDEGIRVNSANGNSKYFTFIAKSGGRYTVNTAERLYDKDLKADVPGGTETWFYTSDIEEALAKVLREAEKPLSAFLY